MKYYRTENNHVLSVVTSPLNFEGGWNFRVEFVLPFYIDANVLVVEAKLADMLFT